MKINVNIEWMIDDTELGIMFGVDELIPIECAEANEDNIISAVEYALEEKYGVSMKYSYTEDDDGDFVILNMDELLEDLS